MQRNDAFDPYGTYPIHQRPAVKDTFAEGVQRTQYVMFRCILLLFLIICRQPIVTGTSVLAIQFKDGIMMAADNLGAYSGLPFL